MTAYGSSQLETAQGMLTVEVRSVNNRYLDISLRLPDALRFVESHLREQIGKHALRGKIELRLSHASVASERPQPLDLPALRALASELAQARALIADIPAPSLSELPRQNAPQAAPDTAAWIAWCTQVSEQALDAFGAMRAREGARLGEAMRDMAHQVQAILDAVEKALPELVREQESRIAHRLREALVQASPSGFTAISGEELSARIAQEASLFGLRSDVAEEIARLRSHVQELVQWLAGEAASPRRAHGKRLDFLFQEMNREANTLGSKAGSLQITQAAIDLKLLIEQMREQAQNIE